MVKFKRIIVFFFILLLPILLVDYYVDSYASFRLTYKKIGKISVDSNYCSGIQIPLSERKAKWAKLIYMQPVENIILGSSRSMMFSKDNMQKDSFYNLSVSGGCTVQDYYSEVYILEHMGLIPENMLIEISPALFNINSGETRYLEWGNSYIYMQAIVKGETNKTVDETRMLGIQLKDIVSPAYFKYNFQQLLEGKRAYIELNSEEDNSLLATQHIDGSYSYSGEYQVKNGTEEILDSTIRTCSEHKIYDCSEFTSLNDELICQFEELIHYLSKKGVKVSFYLPPYSEYMYDYINSDEYYFAILEVEDYILEYANNNNIQVYGSYNPEHSNLQLEDLYDEYHIKPIKICDTLWPRFDNFENPWNR